MPNPLYTLLEMQLAFLRMATLNCERAMECWSRALGAQMHVLGFGPDDRRTHVEIAHGASFLDHYGRRAGDIDPEHDV